MPEDFDVFLSHNSRDKPLVEEIGEHLRARDLRVWLDKWELRPGFPWQEGIEEGVHQSRSGAVFVGPAGLGSWQEPEMRAFITRSRREKVPVIPVLLPGCPESPQLTLFLKAFTWVDLRDGITEDGLALLIWGITGTKPDGTTATATVSTQPLPIRTALPVSAAKILLIARDNEKHLLSGFIFAYQGVESTKTKRAGAAEITLPPDHPPGRRIEIHLAASPKKADEWFLVNPQINIPEPTGSAEVVLMKRSTFRQIAAAARDAPKAAHPDDLSPDDRKKILVEEAARHGLTPTQLETAIRSFAETQSSKDKGIAAYLEGQYSHAEDLLHTAAEKQESDFVETLRYLGATQYEQAKYRAAVKTFRKALAVKGEDAALLGWLTASLHELADWTEAEPLMRRALAVSEKSFGTEHPVVAVSLNNLAQLLKATNRLAEAEPLMRRALAIDETSFGNERPNVAIRLNNLAQLLQDTNRLAEAEPLMRRALVIDEKSFGNEHPKVAIRLNNLALLLHATNRLAEAEPLIRRALAIDEKSLGPEHPNVARDLNNLAQLLQDTNRLAEAEPLMRRALAIDEKSFGAEHPTVARDLNNLATLLQDTNRLAEAEPLMRRALAIDEKSFGNEHPKVAIRLNNLAQLLKATNCLAEAEPLMRRALVIVLEFRRSTGHEHPNQAAAVKNYRQLLKQMGKSDVEIQAMIESLMPL
jgi:tetratricopeptide (TPR) repeat protein